jgi:hypothetical protein
MKNLTNSLKMAMISLLMLLVINSNISCSKGDSPPAPTPTPVDVCPNLPGIQTDPSLCPAVIPAPTGTVTYTPSIAYGQKDTIYFNSFINTDSILIDGVKMSGISGNYPVGPLYSTTNFTLKAMGKGGVKTYAIAINVGQDPRNNFMTQGSFHCDSLLKKAYNVTFYVSIPTGDCNKHTFTLDNYYNPGNREFTTNGACTPNPGVIVEHKWYFIGESGFYWHGNTYDSFTIIGNGFVIHQLVKVTVGGVDHWDEYLQYFSHD